MFHAIYEHFIGKNIHNTLQPKITILPSILVHNLSTTFLILLQGEMGTPSYEFNQSYVFWQFLPKETVSNDRELN